MTIIESQDGSVDDKKGNRKVPVPLENGIYFLLEVTLQQTLLVLAGFMPSLPCASTKTQVFCKEIES